MAEEEKGSLLKFAPFQSSVDEGFWHRFSSIKLNKLGIDESPISITGFYAPCSHSRTSNPFHLFTESLPAESNEELPITDRNRCSVPGILRNANTLEGFRALGEECKSLKDEAEKLLEDIRSGKVEENPALLSRFLVISFADLKIWKFYYRFAFPALVLKPPATVVDLKPASQFFTQEEAESVSAACNEWRSSSLTTDVPFFLLSISSNLHAVVRHLKDFKTCQSESDTHKWIFGFYDPCNLTNYPGWPLRNFLAFIFVRWNLEKVRFLCYRESRGFASMDSSLVGEALISVPKGRSALIGVTTQIYLACPEWGDSEKAPEVVGWELNKAGENKPRGITLAKSMDPVKLSIAAADLNLKLMTWRAVPKLDLKTLFSTKCLLLGAGTLGCQVARILMAWGVRKITLVDSGKVAMSNPLRQSLYTFEDCLNGGQFKATAAVNSLKQIFPGSEAEDVVMAIPMPGHPVLPKDENDVIEDCKRLRDLVESHDVVFLLTDTRESRWLPTLLCSNANKITVTAALGFDSYLVMRHGAGPLSESETDGRPRLGCYFCNDVVAPIDSTANRTLDQQCTVTRPGLAPIASAYAVELLINILHHPDGINAKADNANGIDSGSTDQPLGILPHQNRGSLSQCSMMTLVGHSSDSCTACSNIVVSEYRKRGMEFVLEAINHPTYLEDLTGLTELMKSAVEFDVDWDDNDDDDKDDDFLEI